MAVTGSDPGADGLYSVGLSHRTTDIDLREQLYIRPSALPNALEEIRQDLGVPEAVILSTCNRFEIYLPSELESAARWIAGRVKHSGAELEKLLKPYRRADAVQHLFSVAGGLEAQVVGEPQILGQVRDAYETARRMNLTGPVLNPLFQRAISVGRRVRTETRLSEIPVSVSSVAVRLCEKIFGRLGDRTVLVVGAGEMAGLAAQQLHERGARIVLFSTRGRDSAEQLARIFDAKTLPLESLPDMIPSADIVISASGAPHLVVQARDIQASQEKRKFRPLFLVDLAVPRNIDPAADRIDNVFLYNLDDLQGISDEHRRDREKEIPRCEGIIREEVLRFWESVSSAREETAIRRLHEQIASVVGQELSRAGIAEESQAALKKSIPNRILSEAFKRSRAPFQADDRQALLRALKEFFGL